MMRKSYILSSLGFLFLGTQLLAAAAPSRAPQDSDAAQGTSGSDAKGASDQASASLLDKARTNFAKNDFAQASFAAEHVTAPSLKKEAQSIVSQIHQYVSALQDGVAAEARHDPVAAIQSYAVAVRIKSDGPGDPAARITRIQQQAALAGAAGPSAKDKIAQHNAHLAAEKVRAATLVTKALSQERTGDSQGALSSFGQAQAADPLNSAAVNGVQRLSAKQPAAGSASDPTSGIRAFYAGQYEEAETQLSALSTESGASSRGAIFFYLGAARYYRALLAGQKPETATQRPEVQAAFHQAHALGYVPLAQFVSPALLSVWGAVI